MSIIEEMARNVLKIRFESFDKETVEQAKNRIIDVMGCLIAGANAPGCRTIVDLVKKWGGKKESTILTHGGKVPAHNAAMVNSVMARSYDFEPVGVLMDGKDTPCHISGTTVPTVFAVAEQKASSGRDLLTALILGDDFASRIIAASNFSIDSGWDNTGTVNMFGATAVAGRLWGLDEHKMLNAFGIVLNQMAGSFQSIYDGTHCLKLPQGLAARAGIFSVELASQGFTGVKDPLYSKHGYFNLYCRNSHPEALAKDLGKIFYGDHNFKRYPACGLTHAAIHCALELVHTHNPKPEDINTVILNVTPIAYQSYVGQQFEIGDIPQANAAFSFRYTVANALFRRSVRLEHFADEMIRDPKVVALAKNIKLAGDMPPEKLFATHLEVKTKDGKRFSMEMDNPKGVGIPNSLSGEEIKEKFITNVRFSGVVTKESAEKAIHMFERLDQVKDVKRIVRLMVSRN